MLILWLLLQTPTNSPHPGYFREYIELWCPECDISSTPDDRYRLLVEVGYDVGAGYLASRSTRQHPLASSKIKAPAWSPARCVRNYV